MDHDYSRELREIADALDRIGGIAAATAAYVSALPGADKVDLRGIKTLAQQLAPDRIGADVSSRPKAPWEIAESTVESMSLAAKTLKAARSFWR